MRKPLIAGNWKMYKTVDEAVEMVTKLKPLVSDVKDREIVVCPPFIVLSAVNQVVKGTNIGLGAQNLHWEKEGAFTGEISGQMLKSVGCTYIIIGHSERRQYFGETNTTVNNRLKSALAIGLTPIVCVGETLQQRENNETFKVVETQIFDGLLGSSNDQAKIIVIAYEPVWAIGTGKTATPEQAEEVHKFIRGLLNKMFGTNIADSIRILYGGSIKPNNITELMKQPNIDGGLVGGASLTHDSFAQIIKY